RTLHLIAMRRRLPSRMIVARPGRSLRSASWVSGMRSALGALIVSALRCARSPAGDRPHVSSASRRGVDVPNGPRETPRMTRVAVVALLLTALGAGVVALRADAQVRSPRDSQVIVHGHAVPPMGLDSSRMAPPASQPAFTRRPAPPPPIGVDPGYRPLWVPGTYVWNGFSSTYVPGHYVWRSP